MKRNGLTRARIVKKRNVAAFHASGDVGSDLLCGKTGARCRNSVHIECVLLLGCRDKPVCVDYPIGMFEDALYLGSQLDLLLIVWAIDFGYQRLLYGRTGRNLGNRDPRIGSVGDLRKGRSQPFGDIVTLGFTLVSWLEIHLDVRLIRCAAQVVMAN